MSQADDVPKTAGNHAVFFILVTIFIDSLGFGIIVPVLPGLLVELSGEDISGAAAWGGFLMFTFAVTQFIAAPIIGNLSDAYGRRLVLLLSLTTLAIDFLIMAFASTLLVLFLGRMLAGASSATYATANAFIADVTTEEERAAKFGMIGAAWGLGFIFGPAIGGMVAEFGLRMPFFVAAGLAVVNVLYGLFVLPETLPPEKRRPFELKRANPIGAARALTRTPLMTMLAVGLLFYFFAHDVNPSTWTYYVLHKFQWSAGQIGLALAAVGLSSVIVSGFAVGPVVKALGEERTAYLGCVLTAASFFGYAYATEGWMLYPCIVLGGGMGLIMPALRGILSRIAPADAQGELQGAIAAVMSLTVMVAPLVNTQAFSHFSSADATIYFPGAPFFLAGCLTLATLACVNIALRRAAAPST